MRIFEGSYSEYKTWLQAETAVENEKDADNSQKPTIKPIKTDLNQGLSKNELQRIKKRMQNLEAKISQLESEIIAIELALQNPPEDTDKVVQLGQDYSRLQSILSEQLQNWEDLAMQLE